jgi:hypothetical protein
MTTDTEQELVRKVDAIYTALVGLEGQEEDGLLYKSRNHELRIETLTCSTMAKQPQTSAYPVSRLLRSFSGCE